MSDVLIIMCGGAAGNAILGPAADENFDESVKAARKKFGEDLDIVMKGDSTLDIEDQKALEEHLSQYRIVTTYCVLGGEFGTDLVQGIIKTSRSAGCKVVSIFGIPMEMEADRRKRALKALPESVALTDCSLVIDMQRSQELNLEFGDRDWKNFLRLSDTMVVSSVVSVRDCLQGPFFSTFKSKLYAFVSHSDVMPVKAVMKAWDNILFDDSRALDDSVIMVGRNIKSSEIEDIRNQVVMTYGSMPEVVARSDSDDSKVIVFRAVKSF